MTTADSDGTEALAERLFAATLGALELYAVYLRSELGLYATLAQHGPLTHDELAQRAGIAPRYAREWLEQQAVAGLLDVERVDAEPARAATGWTRRTSASWPMPRTPRTWRPSRT